jgi:CRP-like cAMP-binding protein
MEQLLFDFISKYITLSDEEKDAMLSLNIFHAFSKGDILLEEGQKSSNGYFVLKGCIRVYYNKEGEEKTTAFYTEMDVLTPNCVQTKAASEYYISCIEDSILVLSNPDMEAEIFEKFPKFEKLCRVLSEELLAKNQTSFDYFKTSSPEERYGQLEASRPDLLQRVPQHQIASYLGITPQSLSRLRKRILDKKS